MRWSVSASAGGQHARMVAELRPAPRQARRRERDHAVTRVPAPGGLSIGQRAAQRADAVGEPLDARAAVERRPAHAVVAHLHRHAAVAGRSPPRSPSRRPRACRRSRGTPTPRSRPRPRPRPAGARPGAAATSTGSGGPRREVLERGRQPAVGEDRRDGCRAPGRAAPSARGWPPRPPGARARRRSGRRSRRAARPSAGSARAPRAAAGRRRGGRARCAGARRPPRR